MTIEALLIAGSIAGLLVGFARATAQAGCATLWVVPIAMVAYIAVWQSLHPENIRSTSGLDFVFGPLWPSLGALGGFGLARLVRVFLAFLRRSGG